MFCENASSIFAAHEKMRRARRMKYWKKGAKCDDNGKRGARMIMCDENGAVGDVVIEISFCFQCLTQLPNLATRAPEF